jgi:hypothetical protein
MEFKLNGLLNDVIHILGVGSEDGGIVKLNAVSQVGTRYFLGRQAHGFDVVPGQHTTHLVEYSPNIGQEGD